MPPHLENPARLVLAAAAAVSLIAGCASSANQQPNPGGTASTGKLRAGPGHHKLRQIPAKHAPRLRLNVANDAESGWNLHLITKRFQFTPAQVNQQVKPQAGHAHVYVDGKKLTRIYGPWFYLSPDMLPKGEHTLTVKLTANDHSLWAVKGDPIAASAKVTNTGSTEGHPHGHGDHMQTSRSPSPQAADVTRKITIKDGNVAPPMDRVQVNQGQRVRLMVKSDQPDHVHVHGYDLEKEVTPGRPAVISFTADQTGLFEVETHQSALQLLQLQVQ